MNWSTCDDWIGLFGFYTPCLKQQTCHILLLINRYGELAVIWRKNMFDLCGHSLRVGKISTFKKLKYVLSIRR